MGGIGKTTLAEIVFHKLSSKFEACCFLRNVRENSEQPNGLDHLEKSLLKEILKEEGLSIGSTFVQERLIRTKVLIVLDDVSDSMQMERLVGNRLQYGTGSRIIITSRDRSTFGQAVEEDKIYEVEGLKPHDALQLFCSRAFKNNNTPTIDYKELPEKVVDYAGGIPLAVVTLGSLFLNRKSKEEWEDELNKLKQFPNENIQRVLRLSYDQLERNEKEIFLDIACFHKGKHVDDVKEMLDIRGFYVEAGIRALIDASLISIDSARVQMHDLIQEMGCTIANEQSKDPHKRNRLFNDEDVYHVLESNRGTRHVQAILIKCWQIEKRPLKRADFKVMFNLKMLIVVYSKHFGNYSTLTTSLDLPNSLRYLYWYKYPLESLPSHFSPENLVALHMPYSRVKQLWKEDKRLVNLKVINLQYSSDLIEVPNLSRSKKIGHINLHGCESLVEIPSYFLHLDKLTYLDLSWCSTLESFPEIVVPRKHLESLILKKTAVQELHSSIKFLPALKRIDLIGCKRLLSIPKSICELKSLERLHLKWCSIFYKFPRILEPMEHLNFLSLEGTAVEKLPSSIGNLIGLETLDLGMCKNLKVVSRSIYNLTNLKILSFYACQKLKILPSNSVGLLSLEVLNLSHSGILGIPDGFVCTTSLRDLDLSRSMIRSLPASIKQASQLYTLRLIGCKWLQSLPELPVVRLLQAHGCTSLKTVSSSRTTHYTQGWDNGELDFSNCRNLDHNAKRNIMDDAQLRIMQVAIASSKLREEEYFGELDFSNCRNLDHYALSNIMDYIQLRIMQVPTASSKLGEEEEEEEDLFGPNTQGLQVEHSLQAQGRRIMQVAIASSKLREKEEEEEEEEDADEDDDHECYSMPLVSVVCPGKDIPNWFSYQSEEPSVNFELHQDWFRTGLLGFALAAVVSCELNCQLNLMVIRASFNAKFMGESHKMFTSQLNITRAGWKLNDYCYDQHHVYLWNVKTEEVAKKCCRDFCKHANEASVEFCLVDEDSSVPDSGEPSSCMKVKKCGICPLYAEDAERFKFDHVIMTGVPEAKRVIVLGEEEEEIRHDDFESSEPKDGGSSDESEEEASGSEIDNSADLKPMRITSLKPMLFKSLKSTCHEEPRPYYNSPRYPVEDDEPGLYYYSSKYPFEFDD